MRYRIPSNKQMRRLCAEPGEEDGLDPRLEARRSGRDGRSRHAGGGAAFGPGSPAQPVNRKAAQLCRQVAVTLDEVLAECGDGVLRNLHVVNVEPFPDASRLLVTVSAVDAGTGSSDPTPCWNTSSTPADTSVARSPRPSPASAPPARLPARGARRRDRVRALTGSSEKWGIRRTLTAAQTMNRAAVGGDRPTRTPFFCSHPWFFGPPPV